MTRRRQSFRDPMDSEIESVLGPGCFVGWNEGTEFVSDLRAVERKIGALADSDPARAVTLYGTFIAACNLKAEEIDDSDGEFGTFAGELFCGWIRTRQKAAADRGETARILLSMMSKDNYGFCNDLGKKAPKVLDREGLVAFEQEVRSRFEAEARDQAANRGSYMRDRWSEMLKSIYTQQRSIAKYLALAERTGLTQSDCETIATMLQAKRRPTDALAWLERGIAMEKPDSYHAGAGYKLTEMRRFLLAKLGRGSDALESAWAEFQKHPGRFTYEELFRYVPKAHRQPWHNKAMVAAESGDLADVIELWISTNEIERLAARLDRASNAELKSLSHYVTEPAAGRLAQKHPPIAAKVYRALCMRILDAGKSKYYYAALAHLEEARRCYQAAGLDDRWKALVAEIRRDHCRKSGFMPGLEAIVAGRRARIEPSFLERARGQWGRKEV